MMKKMNLALMLVLCAAGVCLVVPSGLLKAEEQSVGITVELLKSEFQVCEEITLHVLVENSSTDVLWLPDIDSKDRSWIDIELRDSTGKRLEYTGLIPTMVG